jgi:1-acyl-sn-glycerol-3-phosphate acyltransferase
MTAAAANAAALARRTLWRAVLALTGGLHVEGAVPSGPCVIVANHSSHADTAVLLAALHARTRPGVAAAADYWFASRLRTAACRGLVGAFPVRRDGGGSADLLATSDALGGGRIVIVYPEGTRSRDGGLARFHSGAARLAARAGVPLVPAAIVGTRELLPVHGRLPLRRTAVEVRFGAPTGEIAAARGQIEILLGASGP